MDIKEYIKARVEDGETIEEVMNSIADTANEIEAENEEELTDIECFCDYALDALECLQDDYPHLYELLSEYVPDTVEQVGDLLAFAEQYVKLYKKLVD